MITGTIIIIIRKEISTMIVGRNTLRSMLKTVDILEIFDILQFNF